MTHGQNAANSVLVTGASTGFGRETAFYLAERGFQVYASMRDMTRRADLDGAAARRQVNLSVLPLDVTDQVSVNTALQTVVEESGGIYGVVNVAGQFVRGYFEDLLESEIRQVFETNVFGSMAIARAALPYMRAARRGRMVFITSVAAKIGAPCGCGYGASRFAQEGFAESLSQEVTPLGMHVSLIEPGITKTEKWTFDRGAAARARDTTSPYYDWFCRAERIFNRAMQSSPITALNVAQAVHQALTARQPRLRYVVGRRASLVIALRRYLPGELFERLYFGEVMRRVTGSSWRNAR